jgi:hypothetical protein
MIDTAESPQFGLEMVNVAGAIDNLENIEKEKA